MELECVHVFIIHVPDTWMEKQDPNLILINDL